MLVFRLGVMRPTDGQYEFAIIADCVLPQFQSRFCWNCLCTYMALKTQVPGTEVEAFFTTERSSTALSDLLPHCAVFYINERSSTSLIFYSILRIEIYGAVSKARQGIK